MESSVKLANMMEKLSKKSNPLVQHFVKLTAHILPILDANKNSTDNKDILELIGLLAVGMEHIDKMVTTRKSGKYENLADAISVLGLPEMISAEHLRWSNDTKINFDIEREYSYERVTFAITNKFIPGNGTTPDKYYVQLNIIEDLWD
jgi:hypothetical protein